MAGNNDDPAVEGMHRDGVSRRRPFKRGLLSFSSEDQDIFFGREREIENLINTIQEERIVIVIGPSGCGKTSLINAGIVPNLRRLNYPVVYSFVLEQITKDVLRAINHELEIAGSQPVDQIETGLELLSQRSTNRATAALRISPLESESELAKLRQKIADLFNEDDVKNICFDLGVDYDALSGDNKIAKIRELISHMKRRGELQKLIEKCIKERPHAFRGLESQSSVQGSLDPLPVVLIVDQFEKALHSSHDPKDLEKFLKELVFLLKRDRQIAKIVVVVRSDWLSYLAMEVRSLELDLRVYALTFLVDYLSRDAARLAITRPLRKMSIPFEDRVVEDILDSLLGYSYEASVERKFIQPIQLQLVMDSLCSLAEQRGDLSTAFTWENYQASGGVAQILRDYLSRTLAGRPDAWRLLARFITEDGRSNKSLPYAELLAVPAAKEVEADIQELVRNGLVQIYEVEKGVKYCRLSHDYIGDAVNDYLERNPDQQGWKLAEDWLARATQEWLHSSVFSAGERPLLDRSRYLHIYEFRDKLQLGDASRQLLIRTALRNGEKGLDYWLSRNSDDENDLRIIAEELLSPQFDRRVSARKALSLTIKQINRNQKSTASDSSDSLRLSERARRYLHSALLEAFKATDKQGSKRNAAAQALWTLGVFDSFGERAQIAGVVLGQWMRSNWRSIALYVFTGFLITALILGMVFLRVQRPGTWESVQTLKAGWIPVVTIDPIDSSRVFILTAGGPRPNEGTAVYIWQGNQWQLQSRDFVRAYPSSMLILPSAGSQRRLVASFPGAGILISEDEGKTWQVANAGLPSMALTSLAFDPDNPSNLFVSAGDWGGVLTSSDGGYTWNLLDYFDPDIFGASITRIVYTRANSGSLVAGTGDGRILSRRMSIEDWEVSYGLSAGGISALVVAPSDEQIIYAGTYQGYVLRSRDGGLSFDKLGRIPNGFRVSAIAVDPHASHRLFARVYGVGGYTLWESRDMGESWQKLEAEGLPRTLTVALLMTDDGRLFAGTFDGLFSSADGGVSWRKEEVDAPLAPIYTLAMSEEGSAPIYAAVSGSVFVDLDGDLKRWTLGKGLHAEEVRALDVDPSDPLTAYAGVLAIGEWSIFVTHDGGLSWQPTNPAMLQPGVPDIADIDAVKSKDGRTILYAGARGCGVIRSDDGGKSWETFGRRHCSDVLSSNSPVDVQVIAASPVDSARVYAAVGNRIYSSKDGGNSWDYYEFPSGSPIVAIAADPYDARLVYLITTTNGFWRSADGGKSWSQRASQAFVNTQLSNLIAVPGSRDHLVIVTYNGDVFTSSDQGDTWTSIREHLAVGQISSVVTNSSMQGRILIGSLKDGMALFTPNPLYGILR